jgi:hypothetical protein
MAQEDGRWSSNEGTRGYKSPPSAMTIRRCFDSSSSRRLNSPRIPAMPIPNRIAAIATPALDFSRSILIAAVHGLRLRF